MIEKIDKKHYNRNFEISLIISLSILILLFLFVPFPKNDNTLILDYSEPFVELVDIPNSVQTPDKNLPKLPKAPKIVDLSILEFEDEFLDDVEIEEQSIFDDVETVNPLSKGTIYASELSYIPRQLLVVLPNQQEYEIDGKIKLLVLVDERGIPIDHQELQNTLNCKNCLKEILNAVYKSKWQPVSFEGQQKKYWVEKTFEF